MLFNPMQSITKSKLFLNSEIENNDTGNGFRESRSSRG